MLPAPEPVGQDTAVAPLVGLPALLDAQEHHALGAIRPELEPGPVGQSDVAPEPGDGGGGVTEDLELHVGILLLVGQELVLAVLGELGRAGQAPGLERGLGSVERIDNKYEFMIYSLVTFAKKKETNDQLTLVSFSEGVFACLSLSQFTSAQEEGLSIIV